MLYNHFSKYIFWLFYKCYKVWLRRPWEKVPKHQSMLFSCLFREYMGMLWSFDGQGAGQYFWCWRRCIKLIWDVLLPCQNYFIDNLLADGFLPTRHKFLSRYVKFFQRLLKSSSPEVALLANIVGSDKSSTTGRNLNQISTETGMNPWCTSASSICKNLSFSKFPQSQSWRYKVNYSRYWERARKWNNGA